jgi:hypothetical protein
VWQLVGNDGIAQVIVIAKKYEILSRWDIGVKDIGPMACPAHSDDTGRAKMLQRAISAVTLHPDQLEQLFFRRRLKG